MNPTAPWHLKRSFVYFLSGGCHSTTSPGQPGHVCRGVYSASCQRFALEHPGGSHHWWSQHRAGLWPLQRSQRHCHGLQAGESLALSISSFYYIVSRAHSLSHRVGFVVVFVVASLGRAERFM